MLTFYKKYFRWSRNIGGYTDTQYGIVLKAWTKHIVYRHLPLQYYEIVLRANS